MLITRSPAKHHSPGSQHRSAETSCCCCSRVELLVLLVTHSITFLCLRLICLSAHVSAQQVLSGLRDPLSAAGELSGGGGGGFAFLRSDAAAAAASFSTDDEDEEGGSSFSFLPFGSVSRVPVLSCLRLPDPFLCRSFCLPSTPSLPSQYPLRHRQPPVSGPRHPSQPPHPGCRVDPPPLHPHSLAARRPPSLREPGSPPMLQSPRRRTTLGSRKSWRRSSGNWKRASSTPPPATAGMTRKRGPGCQLEHPPSRLHLPSLETEGRQSRRRQRQRRRQFGGTVVRKARPSCATSWETWVSCLHRLSRGKGISPSVCVSPAAVNCLPPNNFTDPDLGTFTYNVSKYCNMSSRE